MSRPAGSNHWTSRVYRHHADLFFDVEAALFQNERLTRQELAEVTRLAAAMHRRLRSPIVDLACGPGRHSIALMQQGHKVVGVDFSTPFLRLARDAARDKGGTMPLRFACGDLRRLQFRDGTFHTALLLGNSFGYFNDGENQAILREIRRVLASPAFLCLEITHRDNYLDALQPYEEEMVEGQLHPPLRCQWWKSWDPAIRRVITHERHTLAETGEVVYEGPYDMRLYDWPELRQILLSAGFTDLSRTSFTPPTTTLGSGLGSTFGAMSKVLFVGAVH